MAGRQIRVMFADGREEDVTVKMGDTLHYSYVWKKNNWPSPTDDKMLAGVYAVFAASRREGKFSGSWDQFQDAVDAVQELTAPDPTSPAYPPVPADQGDPTVPDPPVDTAPPMMMSPGMPAEDQPASMAPQEPGPIGSPIQAGHSMTSPSLTTMTPPADSSRHSL